MTILAIDPGKQKCGLAVVTHQAVVLEKLVVPLDELNRVAARLIAAHAITLIVVGDRTNSQQIQHQLEPLGLIIKMIDEDWSSREGRYRYLQEHTTGWARLLPIGLRTPSQPYDDYVAVVLAERFFRKDHKDHNFSSNSIKSKI